MIGKPRQHALEDLVVGPFEGQPAAPFVGDGEHAVDVGKILAPGAVAKPVGDVARRARRAVHRADHGDVIPRADPAVGPQVAAETSVAGPAGDGAGCSVAKA